MGKKSKMEECVTLFGLPININVKIVTVFWGHGIY